MKDVRITVGKVTLAVRESGRGEPVVFLHYGGGNLVMWEPTMASFEPRARCIRFDLRGHGRSDAPRSGYRLEDMALDLLGLLDHLKIRAAHLVGSSLGAEVALTAAAMDPERALSLVLDGAFSSEYGPFGVHEAPDLSSDPETLRELEEQRVRPEVTYPSAEAYLAKKRQVFEECGQWNAAMEAVARYGVAELPDGRVTNAWRKWARDEYMGHYFGARLEAYYEAVECPVLMLPGAREMEDPLVSDALSRFSRMVDRCDVVQVLGAEHPYGWLFVPREMSTAVLAFHESFER
jgi:2-succinyl-6-hydroxy-2,4-cyclohexadiene-1-carboxylate synthase